MKAILFTLFLGFVAAEELLGYHARVGIPEAARLKLKEAAAVESRIAGGTPSALGDYPYLAGLLITLTTGQVSVCGGTLISTTRVLTAAQCWFDGWFQGQSITVVLASATIYTGGTRVAAKSVYVHPSYSAPKLEHDIAMIAILAVPINRNQSPVRLPTASQANNTYVGYYAHAVGFGRMGDSSPITNTQAQRSIPLPVISNKLCAVSYGSAITKDVICTSGDNGWGPCAGDTGGPLLLKSYTAEPSVLIGVISIISPRGCQSGQPAGYLKVTSHLNWINSFL